jgi:uncharacterized pyridoxal phosphate-containing UPF0001 family protein
MTGSIAERIATVRDQLPAGVRLIAVTKQVPVDAMREAYFAGVRDFGESRLQEAEAKIAQLKGFARPQLASYRSSTKQQSQKSPGAISVDSFL